MSRKKKNKKNPAGSPIPIVGAGALPAIVRKQPLYPPTQRVVAVGEFDARPPVTPVQLNAKWGRRDNKQQEETAERFCDECLSLKHVHGIVDRGARVASHTRSLSLRAAAKFCGQAAKWALESQINQHKANKKEKSGADL